MSYSLDQFVQDCRKELAHDQGPAGRLAVCRHLEDALRDQDFVASVVGPDSHGERQILYEDPDYGFCVLAHVYEDAKGGNPHDHAGTWAIYGQAAGITSMTDWEVVERPKDGNPGKAKPLRTYTLEPGQARVYEPEDLHSPSRAAPTRLIRIEGRNMTGVERDLYEPL